MNEPRNAARCHYDVVLHACMKRVSLSTAMRQHVRLSPSAGVPAVIGWTDVGVSKTLVSIMSPRALIEPKNLSNIFFTSNSWEDDFVGSLVPYVHPELVISTGESVSDGRGVIATASIKAGTCLFVTPPTVEANKLRVKEKFVVSASSDLAELSEEDLVRAMRTAMNRRDFERINSFLVLVGAETSNQAPCIQERDNLQYKLLGNCSEPLDEQIIRNVSDADLISIVRRNGTLLAIILEKSLCPVSSPAALVCSLWARLLHIR